MSDEPLSLTSDGPVRVLTVNRPARRNAIDRATMAALDARLVEVQRDTAARVLVVTGAGDKAFVAGADISEFLAMTPAEARQYARDGQAVMRRLETLGIPSVAAINGHALGGGCELAMACTFRVMASSARVGLPEVKLGLIPGFGGTQRLSRLVGRQRALELILTGRLVDADEAVAMGLVLRAVAPEDLRATALDLAHTLAGGAPRAQAYALAAVDEGLDVPLATGCDIEAEYFGLAAATDDMREGVAAFLEKRSPSFTGR
jgi:enoyl-CoA hydratase